MTKERHNIDLTINAQNGIQRLTVQIEKGRSIKERRLFEKQNYDTWRDFTTEDLQTCFGAESVLVKRFIDLGPCYHIRKIPQQRSPYSMILQTPS